MIETQIAQKVPIVLVGLQSDLLDSAQLAQTGNSGFYSFKGAFNYSKQLGCTSFLLCSAKTYDGIDEVWKEISKWKYFKYVPEPKYKGNIMDRIEKTKESALPYQKD